MYGVYIYILFFCLLHLVLVSCRACCAWPIGSRLVADPLVRLFCDVYSSVYACVCVCFGRDGSP